MYFYKDIVDKYQSGIIILNNNTIFYKNDSFTKLFDCKND